MKSKNTQTHNTHKTQNQHTTHNIYYPIESCVMMNNTPNLDKADSLTAPMAYPMKLRNVAVKNRLLAGEGVLVWFGLVVFGLKDDRVVLGPMV